MPRFFAVAIIAAILVACSKQNTDAKPAASPGAAFALEHPLDASSVLVIGSKQLVATKTIAAPAIDASNTAYAAFSSELYPKLRTYCATACHAVNAYPFASDGTPLAFEIAKAYMTSNPDNSKMIQNIRASHNGVDPALAAELAPPIQKVATELAKQAR